MSKKQKLGVPKVVNDWASFASWTHSEVKQLNACYSRKPFLKPVIKLKSTWKMP